MGMTITEKILAFHCGKDTVSPGELINAGVDIALGNDITAPIAIDIFEKSGANTVFDKDKIALIADHFIPTKDIKSAQQVKQLREFSRKHQITHYFEQGRVGVEHALLPEKGIVLPGDLIIGADSHTCTYGALGAFSTGVGSTDLAAAMITGEVWFKVPESVKFVYHGELNDFVSGKDLILYTIGMVGVDGARYMAMEFTGETISGLSMDSRFTMANMAIEAGAKNGIIEPDEKTKQYVSGRSSRVFKEYFSDKDAKYIKTYEIDCKKIEPQIAFPHLPENSKPISEAVGIHIDQAVIGSCTNGRFSDLEDAANILKGHKVHADVRLIIIPATQHIYNKALKEGLFQIFLDAEAVISPPTCGPCLGGHMGVLADGERAIATTNRNFTGRMGHTKSEVYLSNPAVAAASAIKGKITDPKEIVS